MINLIDFKKEKVLIHLNETTSAAKYNFRNGTANEGLFDELLRNGYKNPSADEEEGDTYIYRGGAPINGNLTPRLWIWTDCQLLQLQLLQNIN